MKSGNAVMFLLLVGVMLLFAVMPVSAQEYVLVGWNDLGMHCSNKYFGKIAVLPPFNNVTAQLILKTPNQPPQLINSGVTLEYSIPGNTVFTGKTDFWTYAQQLFGLPNPLPPGIGLTGKGLTGLLDSGGMFFSARGIPLTPYQDSDLVNENPFQLVHIVAKRSSDGTVLAATDAVIPVSNEVGCVQSGCHASEQSILDGHDDVDGKFNRNGPVLCASCHASNALGTTGMAEARPFSYRMHSVHRSVAGPANSIATCYKCHPGPKTQCLRDVMGKNPTNPLVCQNCHGPLDTVANSINQGRRPWLDEPKCGKCHGSAFAEEPGKLFRQSVGHGGLFCSACHGSPHAIQPTVQANDNLQNIRLQGYAGTLRKCSVCHATPPNGPGPHGILDSTIAVVPDVPSLISPVDRTAGITTNPLLRWNPAANAVSYLVQVAPDSLFGTPTITDSTVSGTGRQLVALVGGQTYFWRVKAQNQTGASGWSAVWSFITGIGSTYTYSFNQSWDMISVPVVLQNPSVQAVFPSATSQAYQGNPLGGYLVKDTLAVGPGYWLRFGTAQQVSMTGAPVSVDTIDVAEGWNLIGSVVDSVSASSVRSIPSGIIGGGIFGYRNGYVPSDTLFPAHGYWIKISGLGKLVLSKSPAAQMAASIRAELLAGAEKMTITDAGGRSQTLYLLNNAVDRRFLTAFEMPPVPPDGAFDARFGSNRYVEVPDALAAKQIDIRMSGALFPVRVAWENISGLTAPVLSLNGTDIPLTQTGSVTISDPGTRITVKTEAASGRVTSYALDQNYPNPFNPSTVLKYRLPVDSRVRLTVTNLLGQVVATLVDRAERAGTRQVEWNAGSFASGIYFYRIDAVSIADPNVSFSQIRKMLLVR
jgi:hypothetical protein